MRGRRKRFGRCRVPGHGQHCEVSKDIQSVPVSKQTEKQEAEVEIQEGINEWRLIKDKILKFGELPENWNYHGAKKIPENIIYKAIDLIDMFVVPPMVFPTARETIQLEFSLENGTYFEIEIFENNYQVLVEISEEDEEYMFTKKEDLIGLFNKIYDK